MLPTIRTCSKTPVKKSGFFTRAPQQSIFGNDIGQDFFSHKLPPLYYIKCSCVNDAEDPPTYLLLCVYKQVSHTNAFDETGPLVTYCVSYNSSYKSLFLLHFTFFIYIFIESVYKYFLLGYYSSTSCQGCPISDVQKLVFPPVCPGQIG